jgi:hypothetical protein
MACDNHIDHTQRTVCRSHPTAFPAAESERRRQLPPYSGCESTWAAVVGATPGPQDSSACASSYLRRRQLINFNSPTRCTIIAETVLAQCWISAQPAFLYAHWAKIFWIPFQRMHPLYQIRGRERVVFLPPTDRKTCETHSCAFSAGRRQRDSFHREWLWIGVRNARHTQPPRRVHRMCALVRRENSTVRNLLAPDLDANRPLALTAVCHFRVKSRRVETSFTERRSRDTRHEHTVRAHNVVPTCEHAICHGRSTADLCGRHAPARTAQRRWQRAELCQPPGQPRTRLARYTCVRVVFQNLQAPVHSPRRKRFATKGAGSTGFFWRGPANKVQAAVD